MSLWIPIIEHQIVTSFARSDAVLHTWQFVKHLTLKHRETHGCVVSTVATDALVLKHQAISILSTD